MVQGRKERKSWFAGNGPQSVCVPCTWASLSCPFVRPFVRSFSRSLAFFCIVWIGEKEGLSEIDWPVAPFLPSYFFFLSISLSSLYCASHVLVCSVELPGRATKREKGNDKTDLTVTHLLTLYLSLDGKKERKKEERERRDFKKSSVRQSVDRLPSFLRDTQHNTREHGRRRKEGTKVGGTKTNLDSKEAN